MKNQRTKGFSAIEAIIILIIVAALALGGWLLWHHKSTPKSTSSTTASSAQANNTNSNQQYLTIKEWDIKLPISGSIKDAYYVVSTSSHDSDGQPNTMWLGLTSLNSKGCDASLANQGQDTQLSSVLRVTSTDTDPVSGTPYTQQYPNGVYIGKYYYAYKSWTHSKTCAPASELQAIDSAFAAAVKASIAE